MTLGAASIVRIDADGFIQNLLYPKVGNECQRHPAARRGVSAGRPRGGIKVQGKPGPRVDDIVPTIASPTPRQKSRLHLASWGGVDSLFRW
jgi:hypothetical protein